MVLSRRVFSPLDLQTWTRSSAYYDITKFVENVNFSVKSKSIANSLVYSDHIAKLLVLINRLDTQVDNTPLEHNPQRFGNKAFHLWYTWLSENANQMCLEILGSDTISDEVDEIATYLTESVGNSVRIDYGTGHELAFIAFLLSLFKVEYFLKASPVIPTGDKSTSGEVSDIAAVALVIMPAYLRLVRHLQTYFRMEPAGSHGAWSLDDFQFIPYYWGSSQLIGNGVYEPSAITNRDVANKEMESNLFFSCIAFIFKMKTGPFAEHSSCLQSVSELPHWEKVNSGMMKMFKGEVLNKFPIIQHFLFGNLLKFEPAPMPPMSFGLGRGGISRMPAPSAVAPSKPAVFSSAQLSPDNQG